MMTVSFTMNHCDVINGTDSIFPLKLTIMGVPGTEAEEAPAPSLSE